MYELLLGPRSSQSLLLNPSDNLNFSNGKEKFVIKVKPSQAKASVICHLAIYRTPVCNRPEGEAWTQPWAAAHPDLMNQTGLTAELQGTGAATPDRGAISGAMTSCLKFGGDSSRWMTKTCGSHVFSSSVRYTEIILNNEKEIKEGCWVSTFIVQS